MATSDGSPGVCMGISYIACSQAGARVRGAGCPRGAASRPAMGTCGDLTPQHSRQIRTSHGRPLYESPVSPWTLSWGQAEAWGAFPPLLLAPFVQSCELLLPLCSAPRCCCSSIFPRRLICYKHQPRNPGLCPLCQKKPWFKYPYIILLEISPGFIL